MELNLLLQWHWLLLMLMSYNRQLRVSSIVVLHPTMTSNNAIRFRIFPSFFVSLSHFVTLLTFHAITIDRSIFIYDAIRNLIDGIRNYSRRENEKSKFGSMTNGLLNLFLLFSTDFVMFLFSALRFSCQFAHTQTLCDWLHLLLNTNCRMSVVEPLPDWTALTTIIMKIDTCKHRDA